MTLKEFIKNKIFGFTKAKKLSEDPNSSRYTFVSDDDALKIFEVKAYKIWYYGSGDELLNFYTSQKLDGFMKNIIYTRNDRHYFWSQSATECAIKRVHSGIPNAIISTLSNVLGDPEVKVANDKRWEDIAEENDFTVKLTQQARPLTMACGYGAWKVNFNTKFSKNPLWEYYDAENVKYIVKSGVLIGIIFKTFYKDEKDHDYCLLETRYRKDGNSYIEYDLFKLGKNDEIIKADMSEIVNQLGEIPEPVVIEGFNGILAVPSRYFYDSLSQEYGKSVFCGKLDLFDFLDEILSQASQTNRVSTPIEYYDVDILGRGPNGELGVPTAYNRQFIKKTGVPNGEGESNKDIETTQPDLNFDKYGNLAKDVLDYCLIGVLSPASMGIDVAKKDNADAQREKEKITIMTRNNIIAAETKMIKQIVKLSLMLKDYIDTGMMSDIDIDIDVNYNEFANPSFETQLQVLGSAWANGEISTEKYVELLWGDKLSEDEKLREIEWLNEHLNTGDEMPYDDAGQYGGALSDAEESEAEAIRSEEQRAIDNLSGLPAEQDTEGNK